MKALKIFGKTYDWWLSKFITKIYDWWFSKFLEELAIVDSQNFSNIHYLWLSKFFNNPLLVAPKILQINPRLMALQILWRIYVWRLSKFLQEPTIDGSQNSSQKSTIDGFFWMVFRLSKFFKNPIDDSIILQLSHDWRLLKFLKNPRLMVVNFKNLMFLAVKLL